MFLSARLRRFVMMILILSAGLMTKAQNPTYQLQVSNEVLTTPTTYEFDVYLIRTGTTPLELANVAFGLGFDISVLGTGTPTFIIVPASSEFLASQVPQGTSVGGASFIVGPITYRYLNVAARANPGAGLGTIISNVGACPTPGTRIGRFRLTNTVPFVTGSTMKHIFSTAAGSGRTNTAVSAYVPVGTPPVVTATTITVQAGHYGYQTPGTCLQNIILNTASCTNTTSSQTVSACTSYLWSVNGQTYTASGTYTAVTPITGGCTNTATLNLTIIPATNNVTTASACGTYTWAHNGQTYTASGLYNGTTTNCVTEQLNLTITPASTNTVSASACGSYTWANNGVTYTASGLYIGTTTNCVTQRLNLTITPVVNNPTSVTACGSYTWGHNGQTYTTSGMYVGTTSNCVTPVLNLTIIPQTTNTTSASACATYTWANTGLTYTASGFYTGATANCVTQYLDLTITPVTYNVTQVSACETYTWANNGVTYTGSGVYTGTTSNCVTEQLDLTITPITNNITTAVGCNSYTWSNNGQTYTSSGTYTGNTINCVTQQLELTINSSTAGTTTATSCDSYLWAGPLGNGLTYTTSGIYTSVTTNAAGCTHTQTLDLTINNSTAATTTATACVSYVWSGSGGNGQTYTASGTYTHITPNSSGCDHTQTLILTINSATNGVTTATACNSFLWSGPLGNGLTYTASNNTATHQSLNATGCIHTETLNLTINNSTAATTTATACGSYVWAGPSGNGQTYTASNNIATHISVNAAGCTHTQTLNLTINNATTGTTTATACGSYMWAGPLGNGQTYTASNNTATHISVNAAGCTHTQTLNLTINSATSGTTTITACNSFVWAGPLGNGLVYTGSTNTATHVSTNAAGCAHTETLNLTINNSTVGTTTVTACNSYVWAGPLGNGQTYTSSNNTATHITTNAAGCAHTQSLSLTINSAVISASAGNNGAISNPGATAVACGTSMTYTFSPATCYKVATVFVDGVPTLTTGNSYTFNNITGNHSISVTFALNTYTILSTFAGNGTVTPVGSATVNCGSSKTYTITPDACFVISTVKIDGVNIPPVSSYTFNNVTANHSIVVTFVPATPATATITATNPGNFCAEYTVTLTANPSPAGAYTYLWSTGATTQSIPLTNNSPEGNYSVNVKNDAGCITTAVYNFVKGNVFNTYTILGLKDVDLGQRNIVVKGSVGNSYANGKIDIKQHSSVTGLNAIIRADDIHLHNPVAYNQLVYTPAVTPLPPMLFNTASTTGLPHYIVPDNATQTINNNYSHLTIGKGATVTLNGTVFGDLKIREGATVTFTQPTINIEDLEMDHGKDNVNYTTVKVTGNTNMLIKNKVKIGDRNRFNYQTLTTPGTAVVTFYMGDASPDAEKFTIKSKDTRIAANIYMPKGKIDLNGANANEKCYMTGVYIAEKIKSHNEVVWNGGFNCGLGIRSVNIAYGRADDDLPVATGVLELKAFPNPSRTDFRLQLINGSADAISLTVRNAAGQVMTTQQDLAFKSGLITVGGSLKAGQYTAEVVQGGKHCTIRLIKLN